MTECGHATDGMVTFRWRDSAHKNKKRLMTLPVNEFLRRFLPCMCCRRDSSASATSG
jgi:hypothetical protein